MQPDDRQERLVVLDLLRCIAALSIFAFHFWYLGSTQAGTEFAAMPRIPIFRYGFLGVELFFIISGYVIFMTLQTKTITQFALARFVRLFPTFWFCIVLTTTVLWAYRGSGPSMATLLANFTMEPSVFGVASVDGVYWSLAVELEFYFLIGIIMVCAGKRYFTHALAAALVVDLIQKAMFFFDHPWHSIILSSPFLSYFGIGIAAYMWHRSASRESLLLLFLSVPGAIFATLDKTAFLAYYFLQTEISRFVTVGCLLLATVAIWLLPGLNRLIPETARSPIVFCGGVTYPLYLLHQEIGYRAFGVLTKAGLGVSAATTAAAILTVLLSTAAYVFFDKPVRRALMRMLSARARLVPASAE
ncbi:MULTISPECIES: acyltransferase [unclassified Bradyrhizobium]|uniref:acyltransferase family protein n=1 Tax=unclassified Bradyrhizobium TaxID=2631580 RepID=UPI002915FB1A|nr:MULTISPECIES: acyltransferase [unclassified Bradyrhizobium]